jgi:saccharopine dehydrogenase (NAD+, L-lysine forming)
MARCPPIHLRQEQKPLEYRSFSPSVIHTIVEAGYPVSVECSSTDSAYKRIFDDFEYESAGAKLAPEASWPDAAPGTIVRGLKELPEEDFPLKNDHVAFSHCYKNQEVSYI